MEKASGSQGFSGASGSSDSLHGLKFGKKIYFEDGGSGGSSSKVSAPAGEASPPPVRKGKGVAQGVQQPPRCQVEGCKVDLTGAKAYYCRHKVCGLHSKAPKVVVAGLEQRFCQQCSRFHQLPEFDQGKRSCRRRLAGHNERRRKPPPGPLSSRYGRLSSFQDDSNRFRGFLMDFSQPRPPGDARDVWPTIRASSRVASNQWHEGFDAPPGRAMAHSPHAYVQGFTGGTPYSSSEIPPVEGLAGVAGSGCALSLLSNQPWDTATITRNRPTTSANPSFHGAPMAQPDIVHNYMPNQWGYRDHGGSTSSHQLQHEMGLGQVSEAGGGQFSGELELALQGNRAYDHPGPAMHWSL